MACARCAHRHAMIKRALRCWRYGDEALVDVTEQQRGSYVVGEIRDGWQTTRIEPHEDLPNVFVIYGKRAVT